jgi:hypothetical protein
MNLLNSNIDILSRSLNHWIGEPKEKEIGLDMFAVGEDGNENLFFNDEILTIKDELDESNFPNPLKKELIFLVGIISIKEITNLIENMNQDSMLVILEPNISFFNYALNQKDLAFFKAPNVILFSDEMSRLPLFLDSLFSTSMIFYIKNIKFYFTYYYREYDLKTCTTIVKEIKKTAKYKALVYGNSVDDSLLGFKQNMKNLKHLTHSKDVSALKNTLNNVPAIVVAAGPSLNKNIEHLKKIKSSAVIIAVDTIAQRLCDEGIIPDFICSIERGEVVYSYFYKDKQFASNIPIVGPLLLYPEIFEEHKGDIIIPMRKGVGEYLWLQQILELTDDHEISIGISCAHVAFGFAAHVGASPIILVGQDLAFGSSVSETHAGGTIYDKIKSADEEVTSIERSYTEGYYGADIATTDLWNSFRTWFEIEISDKKLNVINATEGGAKIANTVQMPLEDVIVQYCSENRISVKELLNNTASYPLDKSKVRDVLGEQHNNFTDMKSQFEQQLKVIKRVSLTSRSSEKELLKALNKLEKTDYFFNQIKENWLLRHNLQPVLLSCVWDLYAIEQTLSYTNLIRNREVQLEFLTACVFVLTEIIDILQDTLITL